MAQTFTVIGGNGRTGRLAVQRLRAMDVSVRVLSRHEHPAANGVEFVGGSISDTPSVQRAMKDADGVIVVVESETEDDGPNSAEQVHFRGMEHVIAAARERGTHIVLISQIYITRPDRYPEVRSTIHWRGEAERALRASGLPYTIIRPSWLTDGPAGQQRIRLEQGDTGEGEIARADVAAASVQALFDAAARRKTFEMYGESGQPSDDWHTLFSALVNDKEAGTA